MVAVIAAMEFVRSSIIPVKQKLLLIVRLIVASRKQIVLDRQHQLLLALIFILIGEFVRVVISNREWLLVQRQLVVLERQVYRKAVPINFNQPVATRN